MLTSVIAAGLLVASAPINTDNGPVTGTMPDSNGVTAFLGIPYAAPPVGDLRFAAPMPVESWSEPLSATEFGSRCMQGASYADMVFRSAEQSEDCLYLNVWTPEPGDADADLPVLFYVHGGGFMAGSGDEPRYDGAAIASKGAVVVTVNMRLGPLGFLAHPDLEGANHGLKDLGAALEWTKSNIDQFGGDPGRITVAGESAGSFAATALMASPTTRNKISGVIAQSGAIIGRPMPDLETSQSNAVEALEKAGFSSLDGLRAEPAESLFEKLRGAQVGWPLVDGEFFPKDPMLIFENDEMAQVPLMVGVTSAEGSSMQLFGEKPASPETLRAVLTERFGDKADAVFKAYGAPKTETEARIAARDLASDGFIGAGAFRLAQKVSEKGEPVYAYVFDQVRPQPAPDSGGWTNPEGAGHSTDIEYFMGTQPLITIYEWTEDDTALSSDMQNYVYNFISTGNPNGKGLTKWPTFKKGKRLVLSPEGGTEKLDAVAKRVDALQSASAPN